MNLQSSATLGTGKAITHQERLENAEHKNVQRLLDSSSGRGSKKRKRSVRTYVEASEDSEGEFSHLDEDTDHTEESPVSGLSRDNPVVLVDTGFSTTVEHVETATTTVGGALRRNADGTIAAPRITQKKSNSKTVSDPLVFLQQYSHRLC